MKANYNVTGNDRKALVAAIENLTGDKAIYMRMKLINLLSLCSLNYRSPQDYLEIIDNIEKGDVDETCRLLSQQHESGKQQKIIALEKFGGKSINNLFNFISGCFVAFGK